MWILNIASSQTRGVSERGMESAEVCRRKTSTAVEQNETKQMASQREEEEDEMIKDAI